MTQPGISRIERQTDVYLSTLRSYVEALGGELRLVAEFPDGAIEIANLERLAEREPDHETGELGHADALTGHS